MVDRYDEELFLGYVEGTLTHDQTVAFEKQMLEDARLRNLVAHMVLDRHRLRGMADEAPPVELMQRVNEQLERQMLLGAPAREPVAPGQNSLGTQALRFLVYASLAAIILVCVGLFIHTLMPSPLLKQTEAFRAGPEVALQTAPVGAAAVGERDEEARLEGAVRADKDALAKAKEQTAQDLEDAGQSQGQKTDTLAAAPAPAAPAAAIAAPAPGSPGSAPAESVTSAGPLASAAAVSKPVTGGDAAAALFAEPAARRSLNEAAKPASTEAKVEAESAVAAAPAAPPRTPVPAPPPAKGDARAALRRGALGESTQLTLTLTSIEPKDTVTGLRQFAAQRGLDLREEAAPANAPPGAVAPLRVTLPSQELANLLKLVQESSQSMRVQMTPPTAVEPSADAQAKADADDLWRAGVDALRQDVPMTPVLPLYDEGTMLQVLVVIKTWSAEPASPPGSPSSAGPAGEPTSTP